MGNKNEHSNSELGTLVYEVGTINLSREQKSDPGSTHQYGGSSCWLPSQHDIGRLSTNLQKAVGFPWFSPTIILDILISEIFLEM